MTQAGAGNAIGRRSSTLLWCSRNVHFLILAVLLGVTAALIEAHGAVSEPVACAMAHGALERSQAEVSVAVTGIAGPGGAVPGKPVGTVWIGWARRGRVPQAECRHFDGDRHAVREATVAAALDRVLHLARDQEVT